MKFDPSKHYLGTLCKRGHEWENSGKSLRHLKSKNCIECTKIWNKLYARTPQENVTYLKKWRTKNLNRYRERQRNYYKKNRVHLRTLVKKRRENDPKIKKWEKEYYKKNIEIINKKRRKRMKDPKRKKIKAAQDKLYLEKSRNHLKDSYIKAILNNKHRANIQYNQIPEELILIKKIYLMDYRNIKNFKKQGGKNEPNRGTLSTVQ